MNTIDVIQGRQGVHRYYSGTATVGTLEQLVRFPEDLGVLDEDSRMQRGLTLSAEPTSEPRGYDYEARRPDGLAAKEVAQQVALFNGRLNRATNSLPKSSRHVVTLSTLVAGSKPIAEALASVMDVELDENF